MQSLVFFFVAALGAIICLVGTIIILFAPHRNVF